MTRRTAVYALAYLLMAVCCGMLLYIAWLL